MLPTQDAGWRIVLTGASGGIGQAIAKAIAPQTDWIILVGRNSGALDNLVEHLGAVRAYNVCGDITQNTTLEAIEALASGLGGINLLINNAGAGDFHAFATQDPASVRELLETNLLAPMLLTRRLLPQMQNAGSAQIINVGSLFGCIGYPGFAAYGASKAGLRGFTQALRRELADTRVKVRHFMPRATRTAINSPAVDAMNREMKVLEDMPEDVARQLLRFLSGSAWERKPGAREALLVLINQLAPFIPDRALLGQLPRIRKHMPK